jgi:hypothetical protein
MDTASTAPGGKTLNVGGFEVINAAELAKRWNLPTSWVRSQTRSRVEDPIPHAKLGRYINFVWGSGALDAWWSRKLKGAWDCPPKRKLQ